MADGREGNPPISTAQFVEWWIDQSAQWATDKAFVDVRLIVQDGQLRTMQVTKSLKSNDLPIVPRRVLQVRQK